MVSILVFLAAYLEVRTAIDAVREPLIKSWLPLFQFFGTG